MSTHEVRIIEISEVRPHDNAERLEIVPVGGWQAVVKKGQFSQGDHAVYIEPDYTVPTDREEFAFLARDGRDRHRLKAVRLRGVLSFGLLIPVPAECADLPIGADVMEALGIERYAPPLNVSGADDLPKDQWPSIYTPVFDVESLNKFPGVIADGEPVIVTEKIHGANARYLFLDGRFYMGSRTRWLRHDVEHAWKKAADATPTLRAFCEARPGVIVFGEIFGRVQSLKYGREQGVAFAAFACLARDRWIDLAGLRCDMEDEGVPIVPLLYQGPFDRQQIADLVEGDSRVPGAPVGHMMEGAVIVPSQERRDDNIGRVALKLISNRYWESEA